MAKKTRPGRVTLPPLIEMEDLNQSYDPGFTSQKPVRYNCQLGQTGALNGLTPPAHFEQVLGGYSKVRESLGFDLSHMIWDAQRLYTRDAGVDFRDERKEEIILTPAQSYWAELYIRTLERAQAPRSLREA